MIQGTDEWKKARCGKATASRFSDILTTTKSGESEIRKKYKLQLIAERLTGSYDEGFISYHMKQGTEREPYARIAYEAKYGQIIKQIGFIDHQVLMAGASPDGLVEEDGMIEIKCPKAETHINTILNGVDKKHLPQLYGNLWISGRKWIDFVSYNPDVPKNMQIYIFRIERDEDYISKIEIEVCNFLNEIDELISKLL